VDAERLGVTGISGGGAATFWIAAADERVKVAVPVSGMSDLESYVSNKVINGHCDCMFLVNTYQWEWTTIAALIAPRPILFANSDKDPIFPMDGNRRIVARLRTLYKLFDKPDLVDEYVSKGGHDYRPDLRVAIFKWINKYLKNDSGAVKDANFKALPGKELRVFPEDKDIPKDAINGKIDETFVPLAKVKLPKEGEFAEWKKGLAKELREKSFRAFPNRIPKATEGLEHLQGMGRIGGIAMATGDDCGALLSHPLKRGHPQSRLGLLIVMNEGDENRKVIPDWAKPYVDDGEVCLVLPRGVIYDTWTHKSPPNYVERAHALLGHTVDEGRVRDIASVVRFLAEDSAKKRTWRVAGKGQGGILAAYAALFEPSIKEVVIVDPPVSHRKGPIFLNVLRVLDIPDALGLLAPRTLTLVNAKDKAFDRTAEIYRLAGAAEKLQRK
jgi:hypothetical protein